MDNLRVSLRRKGAVAEWRLVAKDAADLKNPPMKKADR